MFSVSCQYAIRAALFLAINASETSRVGVEKLAKELNLAKPFLAKILQRLVRKGLISSSKGRNGGFCLSEKGKVSNLLTIIEIMDGLKAFNDCIIGLESCKADNPCPYHASVAQFRFQFSNQLSQETLIEVAIRIDQERLDLSSRTKD